MSDNPYSPPASNLNPEAGDIGGRQNLTPETKPRYNQISLFVGIPGLLAQVVGNIWLRGDEDSLAAAALTLVGTLVFMVGLAFYAKLKGRHPAWCLMGLFSLIGLIVLALLGDLTKEAAASEAEAGAPSADVPGPDRKQT